MNVTLLLSKVLNVSLSSILNFLSNLVSSILSTVYSTYVLLENFIESYIPSFGYEIVTLLFLLILFSLLTHLKAVQNSIISVTYPLSRPTSTKQTLKSFFASNLLFTKKFTNFFNY